MCNTSIVIKWQQSSFVDKKIKVKQGVDVSGSRQSPVEVLLVLVLISNRTLPLFIG